MVFFSCAKERRLFQRLDRHSAAETLLDLLPAIVIIPVYIVAAIAQQKWDPDIGGAALLALAFVLVNISIWLSVSTRNTRNLITERYSDTHRLLTAIETRLSEINETRVKKFGTEEEYYSHLRAQAEKCRHSWLDMAGFDPELQNMPEKDIRTAYYLARAKLACRIDDFRYLAYVKD